ncbi:metalloregulator ArsR/SmtB family transcription factor [Microbulbifer agarilyticus]|uniref:metalloregulator ArsR/SmtB family transcription factor n=1 Tax=Microbulbifer agarilyticus TaxID=260552 RepID=UPI001C95D46C|nr:metalloregulator ArsR/SmtB family transcription factor [Microbulbifer agarilyticus]MBY6212409.1 metalloregulator ArsR/SmtB family transcription factor [Microbulbifer agarilyticus]
MNPVSIFKCLADDTRLRSLLLIASEGELCVCELMCALDESQPKISRHLAQLRAAGLLSDERRGQWVYYSLPSDLSRWVHEVVAQTLDANQAFIQPNQQALASMQNRPAGSNCC